ncbi:MAG: hypothetical protein KGL11_11000 [Alphaproteobacteria bacterium]|nr:hypothetical protein [Alphaproteobacteria bacterium]
MLHVGATQRDLLCGASQRGAGRKRHETLALEATVIMHDGHVLASDTRPFGNEFREYLDEFAPDEALPFDRVHMVGRVLVPALLRSFESQRLRLVISRDLTSVEKLHRASAGRMKRLIQTNDPHYHPNASPADTVVMALMRDNVPQGCIASRLIWCEGSLAEEMESGRFWVTHPPTMWRDPDKCVVRATIAKTIRACNVVCTGSVYLAHDVTGGHTLAAMLRLHHLWVLCHWRWSWLVAIIEGSLARRHAFDVYGMTGIDLGIWRTRPGEGAELNRYELLTCSRQAAMESWLRCETADLSRPMGLPPLSILPRADQRTGMDA